MFTNPAASTSSAYSYDSNSSEVSPRRSDPQADEQNVLYSASQTGTSITGLTNQTNTSVLFTSTETLQTTALGQANLTATDGLINNVTIAVPGSTPVDEAHRVADAVEAVIEEEFGTSQVTVHVEPA